ncbi:MAG: CAP domain-containing protein [Terracidiphilus sp.]
MGISRRGLALGLILAVPAIFVQAQGRERGQQTLQPEAEQLLALANEARAAHGAGTLKWDPALAQAARQHCLRMAAEGPISHRYGGEADVSERAAQAGAHFSLIEENVAIGPDPAAIHEEWMHSPGHRTNLLNPEVDRMGAAVVSSRGVLYAVADYERAVQSLSATQVETTVARLIHASGVTILSDPTVARSYCAGGGHAGGAEQPRFLMQWQDSDLSQLPQALVDRLATGKYRQAAIGSCPAQDVEGAFTSYRLAVLLY